MLTSAQVRAEFNVTEQTLGRWRRKGMPCHRVGTKSYRYDADEIRAWMTSSNDTGSAIPALLADLVDTIRALRTIRDIPMLVRGKRTTLQAWLPEEVTLLAESPPDEYTEAAMRNTIGFISVMLSIR